MLYDMQLPPYLQQGGVPQELRLLVTKFRCSDHALAIERGRRRTPPVPRTDRVCPCCGGEGVRFGVVEDEGHFLFECTLYADLRVEYFELFQDYIPGVGQFPDTTDWDDPVARFLSHDTVRVGKFLRAAYALRLPYAQHVPWLAVG